MSNKKDLDAVGKKISNVSEEELASMKKAKGSRMTCHFLSYIMERNNRSITNGFDNK